jgi:FXSXX-COOH protein
MSVDATEAIEIGIADLSGVPLSRIGSLADAGLLSRVLPADDGSRVGVAAFNSSI